MLFAAGAGHPVWRHWAGLAALGLLLRDQTPPPQRVGGILSTPDAAEALMYALVGAEWALADSFPRDVGVPDHDRRTQAMVSVIVGGDAGSIDEEDEAQVAWAAFRRGIESGDARSTSNSLHQLTQAHLDDYGSDWQRFVAASHPLFDLTACAAAALARHRGLVDDTMLTDQDRRYLEPGLADPEPAALFPALRPEPSRLVVARESP
jgi:hypothetical protein